MRAVSIRQARWAILPMTLALWPAWIRHVKYGLEGFPAGLAMIGLLCGWWLWEQRKIGSGQCGSVGYLTAAWVILIVYIATFRRVPPLGSQVLATLIFACALLAAYPKGAVGTRVAYLALFPLTLPLEMALQFVIGYPFRLISAKLAAALLSPYGVTVAGTTLFYDSHPLEVDAACSGILGLWAFMIVGGILSLVYRHRWPRLLSTLAVAGIAGLAYNILRTSLLFMYSFHSGIEYAAMHTTLGAVAFVATLSAYAVVTGRWLKAPA